MRWLFLLFLLAPAAQAQPVGAVPYSALPNCQDTGGNHLNVNSTTGAFTCGTTGGTGGTPGGSAGGALGGSYPNPTLATQSANTVLGNVTNSTAAPTAASLPSCADTGGNHLNYTNGSGFSCGSTGSGGGGATFALATASQTQAGLW